MTEHSRITAHLSVTSSVTSKRQLDQQGAQNQRDPKKNFFLMYPFPITQLPFPGKELLLPGTPFLYKYIYVYFLSNQTMSIERERRTFCLMKNNKLLVFTRLGCLRAGMEMRLKRSSTRSATSVLVVIGPWQETLPGGGGWVSDFLVWEVYVGASGGGGRAGRGGSGGGVCRERRELRGDPPEQTPSPSRNPIKDSPVHTMPIGSRSPLSTAALPYAEGQQRTHRIIKGSFPNRQAWGDHDVFRHSSTCLRIRVPLTEAAGCFYPSHG